MEVFFNMYKIKFEFMNKFISNLRIDLSKENHVYINIEPILRRIIHADVDKELRIKKEERILEFISYMFNLAAHYRLYFASKKAYCKLYLYIGYPFNATYINEDINIQYRMNYKDIFNNGVNIGLRTIIDESIELLKTILEYIDGVYLIESGNIEPSLVPLIIDSENQNIRKNNFIISSDRYDYQYCLMDYYVMRPKQKNSYILYKGNIMQQMLLEEKLIPSDYNLNHNIIPFILSILGNDYRSLNKVKGMGFRTVVKGVKKGIDENLISDKVNNVFILSRILKDNIQEEVFKNYLCTDLGTQYNKLKEVDKYNIKVQLKDKFDNKELKELNDKYFIYHPLSIIEILAACNYKNNKIKLF